MASLVFDIVHEVAEVERTDDGAWLATLSCGHVVLRDDDVVAEGQRVACPACFERFAQDHDARN